MTSIAPQVPTQDQIAQRAYALYLARGGEHGCDLEDWLAAEKELSAEWVEPQSPNPQSGKPEKARAATQQSGA